MRNKRGKKEIGRMTDAETRTSPSPAGTKKPFTFLTNATNAKPERFARKKQKINKPNSQHWKSSRAWGGWPSEGPGGNRINKGRKSQCKRNYLRGRRKQLKRKKKIYQPFSGGSGKKNVREKVGHLLNNKRDEADDDSKMAGKLNCF